MVLTGLVLGVAGCAIVSDQAASPDVEAPSTDTMWAEDGGCAPWDLDPADPGADPSPEGGDPADPRFGIPEDRRAEGPVPTPAPAVLAGPHAAALDIASTDPVLGEVLRRPAAATWPGSLAFAGTDARVASVVVVFDEAQVVPEDIPQVVVDGPPEEAGPVTTGLTADGLPVTRKPSAHALEVRRSVRSLEVFVDLRHQSVVGLIAWNEDLRSGC